MELHVLPLNYLVNNKSFGQKCLAAQDIEISCAVKHKHGGMESRIKRENMHLRNKCIYIYYESPLCNNDNVHVLYIYHLVVV